MTSRTDEILRLLAAVNGRRHDDVSLTAMAALVHRSRFDRHRRLRAQSTTRPIAGSLEDRSADVSLDIAVKETARDPRTRHAAADPARRAC